MNRAMLNVSILCSFAIWLAWTSTIFGQPGTWQKLNGPYGGDTNTSALDSSGNLYVHGYSSGIYKSSDMGRSWICLPYKNFQYYSGSTEQIYVTSRGTILHDGRYSRDGGMTWKDGSGITENIMCYAEVRPNRLFAGTWSDGLCVSTDEGATWTRSPALPQSIRIYWLHSDGRSRLVAGTLGGTYASNDSGKTWKKVSEYDARAAVFPGENMVIFASAYWIFRSQNGGYSFEQHSIDSIYQSSNGFSTMVLDASGRIFLGGDYGIILRSTDLGMHWTKVTPIPLGSEVRDMTALPDGRILASTSHGVFISNASGEDWTEMNHGIIDRQSTIAADANGVLAASVSYNFLFISTDMGDHWQRHEFDFSKREGHDFIRSVDTDGSNRINAGIYEEMATYHTTDLGSSWYTTRSVPSYNVLPEGERCIVDDRLMFFADRDSAVYISTNDGARWRQCPRVFPRNESKIIRFAPKGALYIGLEGDGVYVSADTGATFDFIGPSRCNVRDLLIDRDDRVWVLVWNMDANNSTYLMRTDDGGRSWRRFDGPRARAWCLLQTRHGNLLCGTLDDGTMISADDGVSWTPFNAGIETQWVTKIVETNNGWLVASTSVGGYYKTRDVVSSVRNDKIPGEGFRMLSNYPNPFSDRTTIQLRMTDDELRMGEQSAIRNPKSAISLKVYTVLGREVLDLTGAARVSNEVTIYRNRLPAPGIYFCRLITPTGSCTIAMHAIR